MAKLSDVLNCGLKKEDLDIPFPREMKNKLADEIYDDWDTMGDELDVAKISLKKIRSDQSRPKPEKKASALLDAWTEEKGRQATCLKLAEALHRRKMTTTIELLCEMVADQLRKIEGITSSSL